MEHTLGYPMQYGEGREPAQAQRNVTVAMDGIAAGLAVHAGVAYQHMQSELLLTPPSQLPAESLRVLHLPYEKSPGVVLNKHTRPIMLGSATPRQSQKLSLMRSPRYNTLEDVDMLQHAILKGLSCEHLRRLTHTSVFEQLRREGEILLMFLDLSNGCGQTDRELCGSPRVQPTVGLVAAKHPVCTHDSVCTHCRNSVFLAGPGTGQGGISLRLWDTTVQLYVQCVVDDATIWGTTPKGRRVWVNASEP